MQISRTRFEFVAVDDIYFPKFAGSMFRGLLGHALKSTACITNLKDCRDCNFKSNCTYTCLFETQVSKNTSSLVLQPMILTLGDYAEHTQKGDTFAIDLTLVGNARSSFPFLVNAWKSAGVRGIGKSRSRFNLASIKEWQFDKQCWQQLFGDAQQDVQALQAPIAAQYAIPPKLETIEIEFVTPYRVKLGGKLVNESNFSAYSFISTLLRRLEQLRTQYDQNSEAYNLPDLLESARSITTSNSKLVWTEYQRHSSRQKTLMTLGGLTGSIQFSGESLKDLLPALTLGQWVHTGKNTLFGLGQFRLKNSGNVGRELPINQTT